MEGGIIGLRASKDCWIFYVENSFSLLYLLLVLFDYSERLLFSSFVLSSYEKKKKKNSFFRINYLSHSLLLFSTIIILRCDNDNSTPLFFSLSIP